MNHLITSLQKLIIQQPGIVYLKVFVMIIIITAIIVIYIKLRESIRNIIKKIDIIEKDIENKNQELFSKLQMDLHERFKRLENIMSETLNSNINNLKEQVQTSSTSTENNIKSLGKIINHIPDKLEENATALNTKLEEIANISNLIHEHSSSIRKDATDMKEDFGAVRHLMELLNHELSRVDKDYSFIDKMIRRVEQKVELLYVKLVDHRGSILSTSRMDIKTPAGEDNKM